MKPRSSDWLILRWRGLQVKPYWLHIPGIFVLSLLSMPLALPVVLCFFLSPLLAVSVLRLGKPVQAGGEFEVGS